MKKKVLLVTAVILAGCSTTSRPPPEPEAWQPDLSHCVRTIGELPALDLPPPKVRTPRIPFRGSASCLLEADTPEPVVLYHLESVEFPAEIDLSLHTGETSVLSAQIELLNEAFSVVETLPFDGFRQRGSSYTRRVFLNDPDSEIRYLLMRPDHQAYGGEVERITGERVTAMIITPVVVGSISNGVESRRTLLFRDIGMYSLNVVSGWKEPLD